MTSSDTYHAFMLDHSAGQLTPGMQLAADIHRLMSSTGDEVAALWETVKSVLRDSGQPAPRDTREQRQIAPAIEIIHADYASVKWRRGISGVQYAKCAGEGGKLMRLHPGQGVFSHGHSALEATVVLEGCLDDGLGRYEPGDILLAEPGMKHRPAASGNQACTCFVARAPRPFWRLT